MLIDQYTVIVQGLETVAVEFSGEKTFSGTYGVCGIHNNKIVLVFHTPHKAETVVNIYMNPGVAELAGYSRQKFLAGVRAKLSNERFVNNAPAAVVEVERKKEADSLSKIESLKAKIEALKNN